LLSGVEGRRRGMTKTILGSVLVRSCCLVVRLYSSLQYLGPRSIFQLRSASTFCLVCLSCTFFFGAFCYLSICLLLSV